MTDEALFWEQNFREVLARLRVAAFWLEHLIEDCEINTATTTADINAVNALNGNVRNLAKVSLETSWREIAETLRSHSGTAA